jgi:hypothetical protein
MSTFKIGQKVVCVSRSWRVKKRFLFIKWNKKVSGPAKDEMCKIMALDGEGYMSLVAYPPNNFYQTSCFRPLTFGEETAEAIENEMELTPSQTKELA